MRKSVIGLRVHHEKKSDGMRVDHEKKSDGVRVYREKERWDESLPSARAIE